MTAGRRMTAFTRLGFAARGLLYIAIAMLVIRTGRSEDPSGALAELGRSGGDPLLLAMAAGFVGYGLWRLADAGLDLEGRDGGAKGVGRRIAVAGSGLVYLVLAWQAFRLMDGGVPATGDGAEDGARTALALPGGWLLLAVGGAVLVCVGLFQLFMAYRCSFCDRIDPAVAQRNWVRWTGRGGYAARGIIFLVSGYFVAKAGIENRASPAGGMEQALRWLDSPIDLAVAAGLLLFGLFSLVEARFRIIRDVPLNEVRHAAGLDRAW